MSNVGMGLWVVGGGGLYVLVDLSYDLSSIDKLVFNYRIAINVL